MTQITVKAWGAGGSASAESGSFGGSGGYSDSTISVNPGDVYTVVVGQGGTGGNINAYGFGGTGNATSE